MKKLSTPFIIVIAFLLSMSYSFNALSQNNDLNREKEIKILVTFHCANGKALIEDELVKTDGVFNVFADLDTKYVTVKYDKNKLDQDKIVAAIEKIGYYTEFTPKDKVIKKACSHDPK
ncbi:MAG: heavy-metal-associated domain-containing protein [Bacteroidota bacterium]